MSDTQEVHKCGTYGAYQRHLRRDETPDDACREANNAYLREYRRTHPDIYARGLEMKTARDKAMLRLSREYPARFHAILSEEQARFGRTS